VPIRYLLCFLPSLLVGCSDGPQLAPAKGVVTYNGEPLKFGGVMFQPEEGQPARAKIQPDGTFTMSTLKDGDGAPVGKNKVRVTCHAGQNPETRDDGEEGGLGELLIPQKYTIYSSSGLTVEIPAKGNESIRLELSDK
jgi:hypothetical protein